MHGFVCGAPGTQQVFACQPGNPLVEMDLRGSPRSELKGQDAKPQNHKAPDFHCTKLGARVPSPTSEVDLPPRPQIPTRQRPTPGGSPTDHDVVRVLADDAQHLPPKRKLRGEGFPLKGQLPFFAQAQNGCLTPPRR